MPTTMITTQNPDVVPSDWAHLTALMKPCPCLAVEFGLYEDSEDAVAAGGCLACYDNQEHSRECEACTDGLGQVPALPGLSEPCDCGWCDTEAGHNPGCSVCCGTNREPKEQSLDLLLEVASEAGFRFSIVNYGNSRDGNTQECVFWPKGESPPKDNRDPSPYRALARAIAARQRVNA